MKLDFMKQRDYETIFETFSRNLSHMKQERWIYLKFINIYAPLVGFYGWNGGPQPYFSENLMIFPKAGVEPRLDLNEMKWHNPRPIEWWWWR